LPASFPQGSATDGATTAFPRVLHYLIKGGRLIPEWHGRSGSSRIEAEDLQFAS